MQWIATFLGCFFGFSGGSLWRPQRGASNNTSNSASLQRASSCGGGWRRRVLAARLQRFPIGSAAPGVRRWLLQWALVPRATSWQQSQQHWKRPGFSHQGRRGSLALGLPSSSSSSVSVRDFIWDGRPLFPLLTTYLAGVLKAAGASQTGLRSCCALVPQRAGIHSRGGVGSAATVLLGSCQQVRFSQRRQDGRVSAAVFQQAPSSSTLRFLA